MRYGSREFQKLKQMNKTLEDNAMNQDIFTGQWKQMRGTLKSWWGKLADDDFDRIGGQKDKLIGALQEKYPLVGDVRGIGLIWGIELVSDRNTRQKATAEAEQIMYECLKNGLSFKVSQGNVLQLCPPLIITREELSRAISIIEAAIVKNVKV